LITVQQLINTGDIRSGGWLGGSTDTIVVRFPSATSPPTANFTSTSVDVVNGNDGVVSALNGVVHYFKHVNTGYQGYNWFQIYDDSGLGTPTTYTSLGGSANYWSAPQTTAYLPIVTASGVTAQEWTLELEEQSSKLELKANATTYVSFETARTEFSNSLRLKNYTTTEINALTGMQGGDTVYNTTLQQICFYDATATAWQKVTSATM
jgi:hypothetical protein